MCAFAQVFFLCNCVLGWTQVGSCLEEQMLSVLNRSVSETDEQETKCNEQRDRHRDFSVFCVLSDSDFYFY